MFDALGFALALTQESAVIVVGIGITRIDAQCLSKVLLGHAIVFQLDIDQPGHVIRGDVCRIGALRNARFLQCYAEVAYFQIVDREVRVYARATARIRVGVGGIGVGTLTGWLRRWNATGSDR